MTDTSSPIFIPFMHFVQTDYSPICVQYLRHSTGAETGYSAVCQGHLQGLGTDGSITLKWILEEEGIRNGSR